MKTKCKVSLWGFIFLMSIFIILTTNINNVSADLTSSTDKAVLQDAPNGISIGDYLDQDTPTKPTADKNFPYTINSAQIVDRNGSSSTSNGNIISLANGKSTYGALWSKDQTFDITKPQTISFWVYFGTGDASDEINGEGVAFVLQNDIRGTSALGAGLDGLGVFGSDTSTSTGIFAPTYTSKSASYMAGTAVQNSVALEIDSKLNSFWASKNGAPIQLSKNGISNNSALYSQNGYDTHPSGIPPVSGIPGNLSYGSNGGGFGNIAITYPGFSNTYYPESNYSSTSSAYNNFDSLTMMVKSNSTEVDLTDDQDANNNPIYWHHLTVNWIPAPSGSNIATLKYTYNDISKEGLENPNPKEVSNPIDITKLGASSSNKVRWGFTGSNTTSSSVATKLVAFDSIPESPYADASASITDKTLNKTITDGATDKTVASGDDLSLDYDLNYIRGDEDWKSVISKIKIPDNLTVSPDENGNIATITYADGQSPTNIPASALQDSTIQYALERDLTNTNNVAKISISATANNDTSSDINVKQAPASFTGTNSIAMTSSPAFTILAKKDYSLNLSTSSSTDYNLFYNNPDTTFTSDLNLGYSDNAPSGLTSSDTIFKIEVGNHTYTAAEDIALQSGQSAKTTMDFIQIIEGSGDNFWDIFPKDSTQEVKVTAIDRTNDLVSNTLTYNVTVQPDKLLHLNVSDGLEFQNIHFGNKSTYLKRKSGFNLSVTSLREPWKLSVTTNGLYDSSNDINSNMELVYRNDDQSNYSSLSETPFTVATNNESYSTSTTDNISDKWESDTGLLLKQLGISPAGQYTGTLTWTVSDVL